MPGPAPSDCPRLPEAVLRHARDTLRRKTAAHCLVQRARLALLLDTAPQLGHEQAGAAVGLSGRQVRRWRKRWAAGDFDLADRPGRGRKARLSPPGPGGRHRHRL